MTVTRDTYIFSARVTPQRHRGRSVVVAYSAAAAPHGADLGNQLRDFFAHNPLSSELWLVGAAAVGEDLSELRDSPALKKRLDQAAKLDTIRVITFDSSGTWSEIGPRADAIVDKSTTAQVRDEGLKVMFCERSGLMQAHAGLHYAKPRGGHTQVFLRPGPVLARHALTSFAAVSLLPWAAKREVDRIYVDTNAIVGVGVALSALLSELTGRANLIPVDSFGGYAGLPHNAPSPSDRPLVLISASTSGSLAHLISDDYGIALDDIATLFFVGDSPAGSTLCDLTRTDADDSDTYRVDPIITWPADDCALCDDGLVTVSLEGEDFIPEATRASTRMILAEHGSLQLSDFMQDFVGTGAIQISTAPREALSGEVRSVEVALSDALRDPISDVRKRVVNDLKLALPSQARWIVTLSDPDSNVVAEMAKQICDDAGLHTSIVGATELDEMDELSGGHAFVVAGTIASGRSLQNISRQLRYLHEDHIHYFIVCARPRGTASWRSFKSDLQYGNSRPGYYPLRSVWVVENEPDRHEKNSWALELTLLRRALRELESDRDTDDSLALNAIKTRVAELSAAGDSTSLVLFPTPRYGSTDEELRLNPNFAFWKFNFTDLPRLADDTPPSQADVFFTMSAVMHKFRYSKEGRYALFGLPGHGYVLDPANFNRFNRFNDSIIQASILRAARGMELDYSTHEETSALITDIVEDILLTRDDLGHGGAATEFVLSIARGVADPKAPGALRVTAADLARIIPFAEAVSSASSPLLAGLLQFIRLKA